MATDAYQSRRCGSPASSVPATVSPNIIDEVVEAFRVVEPQHRPLVAQRAVGTRQPCVQVADEVLGGDDDVVEEHLVEVEVVAWRSPSRTGGG